MAQSGIRGISQSVIDNIVALQTAEDIADFNQQADNLRQLSDRLHESGDLGNTTVDLAAVRHFYASKFPLEQLARVATRGLALLAAHPCWSGGEAAAAGNRRTRTHATVQTPLSIYDDLFPLTSLMGVSLPLYVRCAEGPRAAEVAQLSLAQAMVSSGFLPVLATMCEKVATAVKQVQSGQQGYDADISTVFTAVCADVVQLVSALLNEWPGKWFSGKALAPVLPSFLELYVATLRLHSSYDQAYEQTENSSVRSSSSMHTPMAAGRFMQLAANIVLGHLPLLFRATSADLQAIATAGAASARGHVHEVVQLATQHLLQSDATQLLLLLSVAYCARSLHMEQRGVSPVPAVAPAAAGSGSGSNRKQQQQQLLEVPAAHSALFSLLGICENLPEQPVEPFTRSTHSTSVTDAAAQSMSAVVNYLRCTRLRGINWGSQSSSSGSSSKAAVGQHRVPGLSTGVAAALLHVSAEVMLLHPQLPLMQGGFDLIDMLLGILDDRRIEIKADYRAANEPRDAQHNAPPTPPAAAAAQATAQAELQQVEDVFGYFLQLLLFQVAPAAVFCCKQLKASEAIAVAATAAGDAASRSYPRTAEDILELLGCTIRRTLRADHDLPPRAFAENPLLRCLRLDASATLLGLEAGLRGLAAAAAAAAATDNSGDADWLTNNQLHPYVAAVVELLLEQQSSRGSIVLEAAQQLSMQHPQQLFVLLLSMLKAVQVMLGMPGKAQLQAVQLAISLLGCGAQLVKGGLSNSSSSSASRASATSLWQAFSSRCLTVLCQGVQAVACSSTSNRFESSSLTEIVMEGALPQLLVAEEWTTLKRTLSSVTDAILILQQSLLQQQGLVGATAAIALQQPAAALQDQLQRGHQQWEQFLQEPLPQQVMYFIMPFPIPEGWVSVTTVSKLFLQGFGGQGQLAQQLVDFGAAVCAAVPLPYCCNNPGCDNMSRFSELELVGGKGCICAGCEVARYCGRHCQAAHWKQHKAACKQIRASKVKP